MVFAMIESRGKQGGGETKIDRSKHRLSVGDDVAVLIPISEFSPVSRTKKDIPDVIDVFFHCTLGSIESSNKEMATPYFIFYPFPSY
jgi:hypothetical protein